MKIDRVILSSNNNPLYFNFWNGLSKVYFEKFNIIPTLIWFGSEQEFKDNNLSTEFGEVVFAKGNDKYPLPFQTTWALFYFTNLYPKDVCMTIGIDQVPLSNMFLNEPIKDFSNDSYNMLIADAYLPHHWSVVGGASPTAYHIAKGETFNKVYQFEKTFESEIEKICNSGVQAFWETTEGRWGIDETYSSSKLREYKGEINSLNKFGLLCERRIECERHKETVYDLQRLKDGWYSESHLCRPFTNHVKYITDLYNSVPKI